MVKVFSNIIHSLLLHNHAGLLFAFGICRNYDVYQCGDLEKFYVTVTERVESLPAEKIAKVLNGFLQQ